MDCTEVEEKAFQKAIDLVIEQKVEKYISIQLNLETILEKSQSNNNKFHLQNIYKITATGSKEKNAPLKTLYDIEQKVKDNYYDFKVDLSLQKGNYFPQLKKLQKVFDTGDIDLVHQKGQILLLEIWASWCEPAMIPMEENQYLIKKYSQDDKLQNKLRVVALALDEDVEELKQRISEKNFKKIEHYKLNGWDEEHEAIQLFEVKGIPKLVLVDQNGLIDYIGNSTQIDREARISELLKKAESEQEEQKQTESIDLNSIAQMISSVQTEIQEISFQSIEAERIEENEYKQVVEYFRTDLKEYLQNIYEQQDDIKEIKFSILQQKQFQNGQLTCHFFRGKGSLQTQVQFKDKVDNLKTKLCQNLSQKQFQFEPNILDSKQLLQNHLKKIYSILNQHNLKEIFLSINHIINLKTVMESFENVKDGKHLDLVKENKLIQYEQIQENIDNDKCQAINELFQDYGNQCTEKQVNYDSIMDFLKEGVKRNVIGKQFQEIQNLKNLKSDKTKIVHKQGEIIIIHFWTQWCGFSIDLLEQQNQILLKNKEKYGGKVKVYALNIEERDEEEDEFIKELKDNQISFLHFIEEPLDSFEYKYFQVKFIPHLLVIDLEGQINYNGAHVDFDIENRINEIFDQNKKQKIQKNELESNQEKLYQIYRKGKQFLNQVDKLLESLNSLMAKTGYKPNLSISIKRQKVLNYKGDLIKKVFSLPQVSFSIRRKDYHLLEQILNEFYQVVEGKENCKIEENFLEVCDVPMPEQQKCVICQIQLENDNPYYWCYFNQQFVCKECGDSEILSNFNFQDRFKFHQNLIYVDVNGHFEYLKDIDVFKLGKNKQPSLNEDVSQSCLYVCNACDNKPTDFNRDGIRWICLNCRPGPLLSSGFYDYCHGCFKVSHDKSHENYDKVFKSVEQKGHSTNHLLLRVLTDKGGYYDY